MILIFINFHFLCISEYESMLVQAGSFRIPFSLLETVVYSFCIYKILISLYYKIFSKMLKGGPEGLTQLDKLKMFRKVLAISHLITARFVQNKKTPKKYYILQNFLYFWKKKRWISSDWVWVYFFSDQTLAS